MIRSATRSGGWAVSRDKLLAARNLFEKVVALEQVRQHLRRRDLVTRRSSLVFDAGLQLGFVAVEPHKTNLAPVEFDQGGEACNLGSIPGTRVNDGENEVQIRLDRLFNNHFAYRAHDAEKGRCAEGEVRQNGVDAHVVVEQLELGSFGEFPRDRELADGGWAVEENEFHTGSSVTHFSERV